jgi:predicted amidohydrolase YtcJ
MLVQNILGDCLTIMMWLTLVAAAAAQPADLVLRGGKIATMDVARPEARAVAVRGERIVAVGSDEEIAGHIGPKTQVIELKGRLVVPGFIEGHGHFLSLGEQKLKLDVSDAATWDEVVSRVAEAARKTPNGKWIEGRGWHQGKWRMPPEPSVQGYPVADALSRVSPDNPVVLTHGTGHMCLANSKAMELAGVTADTKSPAGGEILRDGEGKPTGVFRETAMTLIYRARDRALSKRTAKEVRDEQVVAVRLATEECLKHGVTSFQDAGSSCEDVDLFKELADRASSSCDCGSCSTTTTAFSPASSPRIGWSATATTT